MKPVGWRQPCFNPDSTEFLQRAESFHGDIMSRDSGTTSSGWVMVTDCVSFSHRWSRSRRPAETFHRRTSAAVEPKRLVQLGEGGEPCQRCCLSVTSPAKRRTVRSGTIKVDPLQRQRSSARLCGWMLPMDAADGC